MAGIQTIQLPVSTKTAIQGANKEPGGAFKIRKSRCLISGVPIAQRGQFTWGYTSGVAPQQERISISDLYADEMIKQINAKRGAVDIEMAGANIELEETVLNFKGLTLLPRLPDDHTHDFITISDDRWRWPNKNVYKTYNLVRKANDLFVFRQLTAVQRPTLHEAKQYYVQWTIKPDDEGNPEAPWTALEIVIDILVNFLGYDVEKIHTNKAQESEYIPGNIVLVGNKAHSVVSRFLTESNNNLYVDENGEIHIYAERIPFGQREFDQQLRPSLRGQVSGELYVVDRKMIRPTDIYLSLENEFEVLLTYKEFAVTATGTELPATTSEEALVQIANRQVFVENVTRTVIDNQVGTLPRGTEVTIEAALDAFGNKYGSESITFDQFREFFGLDGSAVFSSVLTDPNNNVEFDVTAINSWSQIVRDYRTRFRIPQVVMQYLKSVKNTLVDIINPETGRRKPSEVFSIISWTVSVGARINAKRSQGITLDSFTNLSKGGKFQPTALLISGIDTDFGTYQVQGLDDVNQPGSVTNIIRGRPVDDRFFNDGFGDGETELDRNSIYGAYGLKPDWELSVIVSVTLLPRGEETMNWDNPDPPDFIKAGRGPLVEIHIPYDTARFALNTSQTQKYREITGKAFVNEDIVFALREQESARRWVTFTDQIQGSVGFALSEEAKTLRPQGPVVQVLFTFNGATGAIRTQFSAAPISEGRDIQNLLEADILEAIFRQVHFDTTVGTR